MTAGALFDSVRTVCSWAGTGSRTSTRASAAGDPRAGDGYTPDAALVNYTTATPGWA